jgi:hypothetical protein
MITSCGFSKRFSFLRLLVLCTFVLTCLSEESVLASISEEDEEAFVATLKATVSDPDLKLLPGQPRKVCDKLLALMSSSQFKYDKSHLLSLAESLNIELRDLSRSDEGSNFPKLQCEIRSLEFERKLIQLEDKLWIFEGLCKDKEGGTARPCNIDSYAAIVRQVINEQFPDVSYDALDSVQAEFTGRLKEKLHNRFSTIGKQPIDDERLKQISESLSKQAERLTSQMAEDIRSVPEDVVPSLKEFYVKQLLLSASHSFSKHTRVPLGSSMDERRQSRLATIAEQVHAIDDTLGEIRRQLGHLEEERIKSKWLYMGSDIDRIGSMALEELAHVQPEMIKHGVFDGSETVDSSSMKDNAPNDISVLEENLAAPPNRGDVTGVRSEMSASARKGLTRPTVIVLLASVVALAIAGVLTAKKGIGKHSEKLNKTNLILLMLLCTCSFPKALGKEQQENAHFLLVRLAKQAELSPQLEKEWMNLVRQDPNTMPKAKFGSILSQIEPALVRRLRQVERSDESSERKRMVLSQLADIGRAAFLVCSDAGTQKRKEAAFKAFHNGLFALLPQDCGLNKESWDKGNDHIYRNEVACEDFFPIYLALWTPERHGTLGQQWTGYYSAYVDEVLRGHRYAQDISKDEDDENLERKEVIIDTLVRKAFFTSLGLIKAEIMSTRSLSLLNTVRDQKHAMMQPDMSTLVVSQNNIIRSVWSKSAFIDLLFVQSLLPGVYWSNSSSFRTVVSKD